MIPGALRATRAAALVAVAAVLGACDRAIDLVIAPEGGCESACGATDLSCLTHLELFAYGEDPGDAVALCLPVPEGAARTLCDHELSGIMDILAPPALSHVHVAGIRSTSGCSYGSTLFGGGGRYEGGSTLAASMACALDCSTFAYREHELRFVDLAAMVEGTCTPPEDIEQFNLWLGVIHDLERSALPRGDDEVFAPRVVFEPFDEVQTVDPPDVAGAARLSGRSFAVAAHGSCLGVDAVDYDGNWTTYCVGPVDNGRACAAAGELELAWVQRSLTRQIDLKLDAIEAYVWYFVGLAWDPVAAAPVTDATVGGVPEGSFVLYVDLVDGTIVERTSRTTGSSGLFVIAGDMVGEVTVSAPGFAGREALVLVPSLNPSAAVISLDRAPGMP